MEHFLFLLHMMVFEEPVSERGNFFEYHQFMYDCKR